MYDFKKIKAAVIRGGTSKGVYLLAKDLPSDPEQRDRVILAIFGSPDARQINGLGGADPLTSKLAIIAPSERPNADVDYTFGYVGIATSDIDYGGNCGNISQGVGPFAIDEGMVSITEPVTTVRIFNTNTNKMIEAQVEVKNGKSVTSGDFIHHGVPGKSSKILMNFEDSGGSRTPHLLPTGNVQDEMTLNDGRTIKVSIVDASNPGVFVKAIDLGFTAKELPTDEITTLKLLPLMEEIRAKASVMMGLTQTPEEVAAGIPKVAIVALSSDYATSDGVLIKKAECDFLARTKALTVMHKAYAVTGGICVSAAALVEGTVVNEVLSDAAKRTGVVRIGHPSGVTPFQVEVQKNDRGEFILTKSLVVGSSRRIMDGFVYVPN
jgi:hypothetical protein